MDPVQIIILFRRYIANDCTEQEIRALFDALRDVKNATLFKELMDEYWEESDENQKDALYEEQMRQAFDNTDTHLHRLLADRGPKNNSFSKWIKYAAAACIVFLFGLFLYHSHIGHSSSTIAAENYKPQSTFTLANNKVIDIDTFIHQPRELCRIGGLVLRQESAEYVKVVATKDDFDSLAIQRVSLQVAKGRQLKIELIDGSVVVVNSSSTFSFPMAFRTSARSVELEGEAYFEVEADRTWPFFVHTADQLIQVYGTKFNVKSYPEEEKSTTTLLHGKVSVRKIEKGQVQEEHVLIPGEKIVVGKNNQTLKQELVSNETEAVAWTQGFFSYHQAPLKDILRDFARWYNVEVDWTSIPDLYFQGTIPKDYSLKQALDLLGRTSNVTIKINENHITFN